MAQCPCRSQAFECRIDPPAPNVAYCERCLKGQEVDAIVSSNQKVADAVLLVYHAIMDDKMNKMEEEADGNKRRE